MKVRDFSFNLPQELIAQYPSARRGDDRLMLLDRSSKSVWHHRVSDLPALLERGALLVLNNTRVRKARLFGVAVPDATVVSGTTASMASVSGTMAEFLLIKQLDQRRWQTMVKRARRKKPGSVYRFEDGTTARLDMVSDTAVVSEDTATDTAEGFHVLAFDPPIDESWLERCGHIPLPPYIRRGDRSEDAARYQTVYAKDPGSVAAPTAGLHFTPELLDALAGRGIETAFVTLHVGLGTFLPVRTENVEDHRMHEEEYRIDEDAAAKIQAAKNADRKVIACGTTSLRTLESAWTEGRIQAGAGSTSIFIYPGYPFKVADGLFTNFHTPQSTLLMLVSAFAGRDFILESYAAAIAAGYRFFSYGDAMLIV
jgi:S-adenosylmethionine:tRNA ribosyltransferase-isomerase